jgi:PadR family transcriptional regulator, regulatory protein AphA
VDIECAILGFVSWKPLTGYELKKMMVDSVGFYWSGNNNQIYTSLVQLHKDGLVTSEIQPQERYPSRKVYSITEKGLTELRRWVLSSPELPQLKKSFLVHLAWADQLETSELDSLLAKYEQEVEMQLLMLKERLRRGSPVNPGRTPREKYLWDMISENYIRSYETEIDWVRRIRKGVCNEQ